MKIRSLFVVVSLLLFGALGYFSSPAQLGGVGFGSSGGGASADSGFIRINADTIRALNNSKIISGDTLQSTYLRVGTRLVIGANNTNYNFTVRVAANGVLHAVNSGGYMMLMATNDALDGYTPLQFQASKYICVTLPPYYANAAAARGGGEAKGTWFRTLTAAGDTVLMVLQ